MRKSKLFTNARIIAPNLNFDGNAEILVIGDVIAEIGENIDTPQDAEIIDCEGNCIMPGLIDMRVSIGEPGAEHRETLKSAGRAAVAGGITTMLIQPDTEHPIDDAAMVDFIIRRGRDASLAKVLSAGALTKGLNGEEMAELGLMSEAGAVLFSNGQNPIKDTKVMQRLMSYSCAYDTLVSTRPQDPWIAGNGNMAQGELAARMGLSGISANAEVIFANRDIVLAQATGCKLLLDMISSARTIPIIENAKADGLDVYASVNVHNLCLNENDVEDYRTFAKLNPPLRSEDDRVELISALKDGIIDVIVSGHDPRPPEEKRLPFDEASFGSSALEVLLSASLSLYHNGHIELIDLVKTMTLNPAVLLGLDSGKIAKGAPADLIVVDLGYPLRFDASELYSKGKNAAFDEKLLQGKVLQTYVDGEKVYDIETGHI